MSDTTNWRRTPLTAMDAALASLRDHQTRYELAPMDTGRTYGPRRAPEPIITLPTRATFIRDRLAEWCDGYGHSVGCLDVDGMPGLEAESLSGACVTIAVKPDGSMLDVSTFDTPQRTTLHGFVWVAEPTDTGRVHDRPMTQKVASLQEAAERFERADAIGQRVSGTTRTV